jgi:2-polyprenyl-6-methoxyphenol hydroxylase-like FAD-dependent oxidoreductase
VDPKKNPEARREKDHDPVQVIGPGVFPALEDSFFAELLRKRAPWFNAGIKNVYWKLLVRFERRLAERFGENRAWLAGDAAHLTGPAGIQSMNVGLREGCDIGERVFRSFSAGNLQSELEQYEAERQTEWKRLLGTVGGISACPEANPVLAKHQGEILTCLPASGENLLSLAACLGLRFSDD